MNRVRTDDHAIRSSRPAGITERCGMMHFLNSLCATVLIYASVTQGALGVARLLERMVRKPA
jgi:hypothetical protein